VKIVCKKLKGLMAENDITAGELSNKLGIPENKLKEKINGVLEWWFSETMCVVKYLGFSEVREVFPEQYSHILKMP